MSDYKTPFQKESLSAIASSLFRQYAPVRVRHDR